MSLCMPLPPEGSYYDHHSAVQNRDTLYNGEPYPVGGEDELLVILKLFSVSYTGAGISNEEVVQTSYTHITNHTELACRNIWVSFSGTKEHASSSSSNNSWREFRMMDDCLSDLGVPEAEHPLCFDEFFKVVAAEAVYHHRPIVVGVWRVTYTTSVPAIEGLERVRLDRETLEHTRVCAICLVDFAAQDVDRLVITRMPCSHCYHGDCIVQWLHINPVCPMCRFPMR